MSDPINTKIKALWARFRSKAFRDGFVSSDVHSNIAAQIVTMREDRGWTQKELADRAGMAQSRISLLENPSYERTGLSVLKRIASAFDVGIAVRFVPFSNNLDWATDDRPTHLSVESFSDDQMPNRGARGSDWSVQATVYSGQPNRSTSISVSPANENIGFLIIDAIAADSKNAQ